MPRIGKPDRVGPIGKPKQRKGPIGKTTNTFGCVSSRSLHTQLCSFDYPTSTTA